MSTLQKDRVEFAFIPGKRKYLLCADDRGISRIKPVQDQLIREKRPFELVFLGEQQGQEQSLSDLVSWLSQQKMGSYLYFAGTWDKYKEIKRIAEEVGFSSEEAQFLGLGPSTTRVFCCRCHGINEVSIISAEDEMNQDQAPESEQATEQTQEMKQVDMEIICQHCSLELVITDHFSPLQDAYLGYVAKL